MLGVQTEALTDYARDEPNYVAIFQGTENFNDLVEDYATFLHEGDFEQYQIHTTTGKLHYPTLFYVERELVRLFWIKNRFTSYGSEEWNYLHHEINRAKARMDMLKPLRKDLQRSMIFDSCKD